MKDVEAVFVDTNVLVYANLVLVPQHSLAVGALNYLQRKAIPLWINRQVLREYLATMTKPYHLTGAVTPNSVLNDLTDFANTFSVADEDSRVTGFLCDLVSRVPVAGKQVHDANLAATMRANGISVLLTNNVSDFTRFASEIEIVPLESFDLVKNQFS